MTACQAGLGDPSAFIRLLGSHLVHHDTPVYAANKNSNLPAYQYEGGAGEAAGGRRGFREVIRELRYVLQVVLSHGLGHARLDSCWMVEKKEVFWVRVAFRHVP